MVTDFKKRFFISLIITIPILILSPKIQEFIGADWRFTGDSYILFALSTFVFFYGGWPFITGGIEELNDKNPCMMTLCCFALLDAYGYSLLTVFGLEGQDCFWERVTVVVIMRLVHWIEVRSRMGASNALEELDKLMPDNAHRLGSSGKVDDFKISDLNN